MKHINISSMACFSPKLIIRIIDDSYKIKCPYVLFVDPSIIQTGDTTGTTTADVDMMTPTVNMDTVGKDVANNNTPDKSADVHTGDVDMMTPTVNMDTVEEDVANNNKPDKSADVHTGDVDMMTPTVNMDTVEEDVANNNTPDKSADVHTGDVDMMTPTVNMDTVEKDVANNNKPDKRADVHTGDVDMMTPTVNMDTVEEDVANNNKPDKSADVHTGDVDMMTPTVNMDTVEKDVANNNKPDKRADVHTGDVDMMTPAVNMDTVEEDEANNNKPDKSADVHTGDVAAFITIVDNAISDKRSATGDMVPVDVDATIADADITADIASMTFRRDNEDNSREFFASLKQHLDSGQHCDFTMKTDQGAVHCHKLVLSASGSLFQNVFDRISRDRHSCGKTAISKVVLGKVLAWLYYSDITIDETCIEELMIVCGKWKLIELLYTCGEYMSNNMNVNNACWFFRLSRENGIWKVAEKCSYFIREHYEFMHNTKQLEKLTLKQFCNIISNEEINVTNENIVYDSILRLLQTRPNIELLSLCYQSVRLKKLTPRYLISKILNHTRNVQRTDDDMEVELTYEVGIRPRYWDSLLYIDKNHNLCEYDTISCKWVKYRSLVNGRVDPYTAVTATNNRMVIVGGESSREVTLIEDACSVVKMPELPTQIPRCGVSMTGNYIFIVGGQTDINSASCWNSVYEVWIYHRKVETLKPMNHGMASPLVATCRGTLYVIGGINSEDKLSNRRVQALDLIDASADWKVCADLPQGCNNTNSGFVVYEYRLVVLTTKYCMTYDDLADSWSVEQYECQGDELKPVIFKNHIWALVQKNGKHCVKCYCKENNEWKVEIEDVPDVLYTASAMVERSQACNTFHQLP